MINGIRPNISNTTKTEKTMTKNGLSFDEAMDNLLVKIQESYSGWGGNRMDRTLNLSLRPGRKFIKVVNDNSVWGFINLTNPKFKEGDILKAAGWRTPALNQARGNLFEDYSVAWTGPHYISGYSAGGTRKCGECGAPIKSLLK